MIAEYLHELPILPPLPLPSHMSQNHPIIDAAYHAYPNKKNTHSLSFLYVLIIHISYIYIYNRETHLRHISLCIPQVGMLLAMNMIIHCMACKMAKVSLKGLGFYF